MARKKSKLKPMKSRKAGLKTAARLKANHEILKKYE